MKTVWLLYTIDENGCEDFCGGFDTYAEAVDFMGKIMCFDMTVHIHEAVVWEDASTID